MDGPELGHASTPVAKAALGHQVAGFVTRRREKETTSSSSQKLKAEASAKQVKVFAQSDTA